MTYIDFYGSYFDTYIIRQNPESMKKSMLLNVLFERQVDAVIIIMQKHYNRGYVALRGDFQEIFIIQESKATLTVQQNGMPERTSRTLVHMVKSLLNYSYLLKEFWAEAVMTDLSLENMLRQ